MKQKIKKIQLNLNKEIASLKDLDHLESIRLKYLGRKGQINQLFQSLSSKEKSIHGKYINQLKNEIDKNLKDAKQNLLNLRPKKKIDITIPGIKPRQGQLHLITQTIEEVEDIFRSLGFVRRRYPEVETDWYYAEGLNIPKDHPARDDQETFYVNENMVLTAHTSNGQLREMERVKLPPIKMINIGKTYRRQASNTHSPMFHQFEGLMIDKDINITHLIGVSNYFARHYFGPNSKIRLRPHHFQFTEPSFEVDISCTICNGAGGRKNKKTCPVCKAGWLELGGAGMVHPQVLKNGGIDPNKYTGFAFGWGIERLIMMKHQISSNLRDLYSTDIRFLAQF